MEVFLVGGAVRDMLLKREVKDRDFVVVGSDPLSLITLGYDQVGMGFPVFLHPVTGEEYALARREKKVGIGYTGFEFEIDGTVTLEDDLSRRDLTINAMAIPEYGGDIIDPFGGKRDLENKILRHTSDAFAEDPLRVVRLARFFARYSDDGFTVAPETMSLASEMVDRGDLDELPFERFWLELEKVLGEKHPAKFFELLFEVGALQKVRFFKQMLSMGRWDGIKLRAVFLLADACKVLKKEDRLDVFAALVCRVGHPLMKFPSSRSLTMYETVKLYVGRCGEGFEAMDVATLLNSIRAYSMGQVPQDMLLALRTLESITSPDVFALPLEMFERCMGAARTVTAAQFPGVEGKELGAAIFRARHDLIALIIKELQR